MEYLLIIARYCFISGSIVKELCTGNDEGRQAAIQKADQYLQKLSAEDDDGDTKTGFNKSQINVRVKPLKTYLQCAGLQAVFNWSVAWLFAAILDTDKAQSMGIVRCVFQLGCCRSNTFRIFFSLRLVWVSILTLVC